MKMEIKKLILCAAVSLILLPAEEVLGAEQTASVMIPVVQQFENRQMNFFINGIRPIRGSTTL